MKRNSGTMVALLRNWNRALLVGILFAMPMTVALADAGGRNRPHLGTCDTVIPPPPTSFPAVVNIGLVCRFRHLGLTTGTVVQVIDAAGPPSNGVLPLTISQGVITYITANGDELHATFVGEGSIDFATGTIAFEGIETYAGGTGRFVDASGTSFLEGHASAVTLTGF
jgi:hypothetical protein